MIFSRWWRASSYQEHYESAMKDIDRLAEAAQKTAEREVVPV